MPATSETLAAIAHLLPTDDEIARFQRDGYYVSRPIFSPEDLARTIAAQDRFYTGDHQHPLPSGSPFEVAVKPGLRKHDYAAFTLDDLWAVISHPAIAGIAAALTGADGIRFWHDQLLFKPPKAPSGDADALLKVGYHTDRGYWRTCTSSDMITAWVPLTDITQAMGPLTVVPGSHRWGADDSEDLDGNFFTNDDDDLIDRIKTEADGQAVPLLLKAGTVSFHHCRLVHGSPANVSDQARRSIAVHMQPSDNRFRRWIRGNGKVAEHANDSRVRHVDGVPDYTDPGWCPVLWPRSGALPSPSASLGTPAAGV